MSDFVTLTCPSCGAKISVAEDSGRFRCDYCGNEHILKISAEPVPGAEKKIRPQLPTPSAVKIEKEGEVTRLVQRWFSGKYVAMLIFVIPWDAFLCFWYSMAFGAGGMGMGGDLPWIFFVFPIGHLAVGISLTYSVLAGFLNRTVVELTREELTVWFEPLPWLGEKAIKTAEIQQFYCKEKVTHGKKGSVRYQYELHAVTHDNRQIKLLSNIESDDVALFFEQQLEKLMLISDRPVVGELKKGY
jgi:hypothetical protein